MGAKPAVGMTVRVLDKDGTEMASFHDRPPKDKRHISADLEKALLAFREEFPDARFIDVEFTGRGSARNGSRATVSSSM